MTDFSYQVSSSECQYRNVCDGKLRAKWRSAGPALVPGLLPLSMPWPAIHCFLKDRDLHFGGLAVLSHRRKKYLTVSGLKWFFAPKSG